MKNLAQLLVLTSLLGAILGCGQAPAAESRPDERPVLHVPLTESRPAIDGRLDEPSWKDAARTGPLQIHSGAVPQGGAGTSSTEAYILRDAGHLIVGLRCPGDLAVPGTARPQTSRRVPHRRRFRWPFLRARSSRSPRACRPSQPFPR